MKIVVTASGETPDSKVDMRFGRAAYFMLFDEAAKEHAVKNDCKLNAAQGAGIQAAERVAELGAKILISGHCGPKAFRALSAAGVEVYVCEEERAVSQALEDFKNGKLEKLKAPDVEGHWA